MEEVESTPAEAGEISLVEDDAPTEDNAPAEGAAPAEQETPADAEQDAEPAEENAEPSDENAEPSEESAQPSDENAQPSDESAQPSDESAKPAEDNAEEPSDEESSPVDEDAESADEQGEQPAEDDAEPAEDDAESAEGEDEVVILTDVEDGVSIDAVDAVVTESTSDLDELIVIDAVDVVSDDAQMGVEEGFDSDFWSYLKSIDQISDDNTVLDTTILTIDGLTADSLKGIEQFTSLGTLLIKNSDIKTVDVTSCSYLNFFSVDNTTITSINAGGLTKLQSLYVSDNTSINSIDAHGCTGLDTLLVSNNTVITSINASGCTSLKHFAPDNSTINKLDVSGCTSLLNLYLTKSDENGNLVNEVQQLNIDGCVQLDDVSYVSGIEFIGTEKRVRNFHVQYNEKQCEVTTTINGEAQDPNVRLFPASSNSSVTLTVTPKEGYRLIAGSGTLYELDNHVDMGNPTPVDGQRLEYNQIDAPATTWTFTLPENADSDDYNYRALVTTVLANSTYGVEFVYDDTTAKSYTVNEDGEKYINEKDYIFDYDPCVKFIIPSSEEILGSDHADQNLIWKSEDGSKYSAGDKVEVDATSILSLTPEGETEDSVTHYIGVTIGDHYHVSFDGAIVAVGNTYNFTITIDEGYILKSVQLTGVDYEASLTPYFDEEEGAYSFSLVMPDTDITLTPIVIEDETFTIMLDGEEYSSKAENASDYFAFEGDSVYFVFPNIEADESHSGQALSAWKNADDNYEYHEYRPGEKLFLKDYGNGSEYTGATSFVSVWSEPHSITVKATKNGSVTVLEDSALPRETVSVSLTPDAGYIATEAYVNFIDFSDDGDSWPALFSIQQDGNLSVSEAIGAPVDCHFEMPDSDVTIEVKFEQAGTPVVIASTFEDEAFRNYMSRYDSGYLGAEPDGLLYDYEIKNIQNIWLYDEDYETQVKTGYGVKSLKGIEKLTALTGLICAYNELTTLDVSGCTNLTNLDCSNNQLTSLNVSGCYDLWELDCTNNPGLTSLDLSSTNVQQSNEGESFCHDESLTDIKFPLEPNITVYLPETFPATFSIKGAEKCGRQNNYYAESGASITVTVNLNNTDDYSLDAEKLYVELWDESDHWTSFHTTDSNPNSLTFTMAKSAIIHVSLTPRNPVVTLKWLGADNKEVTRTYAYANADDKSQFKTEDGFLKFIIPTSGVGPAVGKNQSLGWKYQWRRFPGETVDLSSNDTTLEAELRDVTTHTVTIQGSNCTVTRDNVELTDYSFDVMEESEVILTVTPEEGYHLNYARIKKFEEGDVSLNQAPPENNITTLSFRMPEADVTLVLNVSKDSGGGSQGGGPVSKGQYTINVHGGQPGGATPYIGNDWVSSANANEKIRLTYDGGTVCAILNYNGETHELDVRPDDWPDDSSESFSVEFTMPEANVDITLRFRDGSTTEITGGPSTPSGDPTVNLDSFDPSRGNISIWINDESYEWKVGSPITTEVGKTVKISVTPKDGADYVLDPCGIRAYGGNGESIQSDKDNTIILPMNSGCSYSLEFSWELATPVYVTLKASTTKTYNSEENSGMFEPDWGSFYFTIPQDNPLNVSIPGGKMLKWKDESSGQIYVPGEKISLYARNTTLVATLVEAHAITITDVDHGRVTTNVSTASSGDSVTITFYPADGYQAWNLSVKTENDDFIAYEEYYYGPGNSLYTTRQFTMPDSPVTITPEFAEIKAEDGVVGIKIDETNFEDSNFRAYVQANLDGYEENEYGFKVRDGVLTPEEIANVHNINLSTYTEDGPQGYGIKSLKGIEHFTSLTGLDCSGNDLTSLDTSALKNLNFLSCSDCNLTSLNVSGNTELYSLYCSNNKLTKLDVTNNPNLEYLECEHNHISTLNLANCPEIYQYITDENRLEDDDDGTVLYTNGEDDGCGSPVVLLCDANVSITDTDDTKIIFTAPEAKTLTYDGDAQELVVSGNTSVGQLQYSLDGENWDTEIPKAKDAGRYTVFYKVVPNEGEDPSDENWPKSGIVTVTIAQTVIGYTWDNTAFTYNGGAQQPNPNLSLCSGDEGKVEAIVTLIGEKLTNGEAINAGEYTAKITELTGTAGGNYKLPDENEVGFTINPIKLTLTWSENTTFSYKGSNQAPTVTPEGILDSEKGSVSVKVRVNEEGEYADVGEYTAEAYIYPDTDNYVFPENNTCDFEITKIDHDPVENVTTDPLTFKAVEADTVDLSDRISDAESWVVTYVDNARITSAERGENFILKYVAKAAEPGVNKGEVKLTVSYKNYNDVELSVIFPTVEQHKLSFDANGGSTAASRVLYEGEAYGTLPETTRTGYTFEGWFVDENKITADDVMGSKDTIATAKWTARDNTITLDVNGHGTISDGNWTESTVEDKVVYTRKVNADDDTTSFTLPVLKDIVPDQNAEDQTTYTFAGWLLKLEDEAAQTEQVSQINVTIDPAELNSGATYQAQWIEAVVKLNVTVDGLDKVEAIQGLDSNAMNTVNTGEEQETVPAGNLASVLKEIASEADAVKAPAEEVPGDTEGSTKVEVAVELKVSASEIDDEAQTMIEGQAGAIAASDEVETKTDIVNIDIVRTTTVTTQPVEKDAEPTEKKTEEKVKESPRVIEIPISFNLKDRYNPVVYRVHGEGENKTITALTRLTSKPTNYQDKEGSYFVSTADDKGIAVIYVYSSMFSAYGFTTTATPSVSVVFDSKGGTSVPSVTLYEGKTLKETLENKKIADPTRETVGTTAYKFNGWLRTGTNDPYEATAAISEADAKNGGAIYLDANWQAQEVVELNKSTETEVPYTGNGVPFRMSAGKNADVKVYYSTEIELKEENYLNAGSTDAPTISKMGQTKVYWYAVAGDDYVIKGDHAGSELVTIYGTPEITKAPTAITGLTENGSDQPLITAGNATNGTMKYSLSADGPYTKTVPTATKADTYTVYYMVEGTKNDTDYYKNLEDASYKLTVTIAAKPTTTPTTKPTTSTTPSKPTTSTTSSKPATTKTNNTSTSSTSTSSTSTSNTSTSNTSTTTTPSTPATPSTPSTPSTPASTDTGSASDTGSSSDTGSTGDSGTGEIDTILTIVATKKSTKARVYVGKVYQIDLYGKTGKGYKSSNKKIATVSKTGLVTPKKAGKCKITFKVGKKKRTITLTVKDLTIPKKVTLNMKGTIAAKVGETQTLTVTLPEGTNSAITWTSSDKKIATVKNGVVKFKKAGTVTITATAKRGGKKAKVKFKVKK